MVYRFSAPLYYANAEHFSEELLSFGTSDQPPEWVCVYAAAIPDIDMSGAASLESIIANLAENGVTLVFAEVMPEVQDELDRYELTEKIGQAPHLPDGCRRRAGIPSPHQRLSIRTQRPRWTVMRPLVSASTSAV